MNVLRDIITTVCKEDVRYPFEQFFIDSIVKEMKNDASNYLNILELIQNISHINQF